MAKKGKVNKDKDSMPLFPGLAVETPARTEAKAAETEGKDLKVENRATKATAEDVKPTKILAEVKEPAARTETREATTRQDKKQTGPEIKPIKPAAADRGKIDVSLGERSYQIEIGQENLGKLGQLWAKKPALGKKVVVISNPQIAKLYGREVEKSIKEAGCQVESINIAAGETYKSLETAAKIYEALLNFKMERNSVIVALGGGVVGDLAGFVAATFLRGINYVQVPTSLLAQVDSSVGGKTAVNHPRGKNLIGVFYQPKHVLIDVKTLKTLPESERRNGLAEVVKYGMISSEEFFAYLERNCEVLSSGKIEGEDDWRIFQNVVRRCCEIKAAVVSRDEREESGLRAILNFGHTIGHGVEAATSYKKYKHGEAVALGMLVATSIATHLGMVRENVYRRLFELLKKLNLPTSIIDLTPESIVRYMETDKKVKDGKLRFVLPVRLGQVTLRDDVPKETVIRALKEHIHGGKK